MARGLLNLPINIPWKQIAVSPDMMDEKFCNKLFPFAWRSSLAISAYEPDPADLPEELCGDHITYLKITATITGYQPTEEETDKIADLEGPLRTSFPDIPTEDVRAAIDRIIDEYFACYGVLLNVAVFPYPKTKKELEERNRINFAELVSPTGIAPLPVTPGTLLDNPYVHPSGVKFDAPGQQNNRIVDIFPEGGDGNGELDLHKKMVVTIPSTPQLAAVEAKVVHYTTTGVTMEAFRGDESVGTKVTGSEQGQEHLLLIEADDVDKVIFTTPDNKASLLEFAYFVGEDVPVELEDYPHIIDLEPKMRDLYQAATETGEVLTSSASGVNTDKTLISLDSTESSSSFSAELSSPIPGTDFLGTIGASTSRKRTETDEDRWTVQTNASHERRETQGTTTQLSQMYNLLTGYHTGTNRAVFLMLPRPHVLQPTDHRTFVQGLRYIEGIQQFLLIVARPEEVKGLCVEALLETGHFPEDVEVEQPPDEFDESHEDFIVQASAKEECVRIEGDAEEPNPTATFTVDEGWVIDRREKRRRKPNEDVKAGWADDHAGLAEVSNQDTPQAEGMVQLYDYRAISATTVQVMGRFCPIDENSRFKRSYRVFTRSTEPKLPSAQGRADVGRLLITSRGLCACFKSGEDCPEVVPPPLPPPPYVESIVDEPLIKINSALLTRAASSRTRLPAIKEFLRKIHTAMTTSWRVPRRHAFGKVGFLESDYFKDRIKELFPKDRLEMHLTQVRGLPKAIVKSLGEDCTIAEALELDLASFAKKMGLSVEDATKARHILLGLAPERGKDYKPEAKK